MKLAEKLVEALEGIGGEELRCQKGRVYVLPCGKKTSTWLVKEGVFYTSLSVQGASGELANTVWRVGDFIHSFDEDIMLPAHVMADGILLKVDSDAFNERVKADPALGFELAEHYHDQFRHTLMNYCNAALEPSKQRIAQLEEMFDSIEELNGERVDDTTLALFLGMHRVSVSRLRRERSKEASASAARDAAAGGK